MGDDGNERRARVGDDGNDQHQERRMGQRGKRLIKSLVIERSVSSHYHASNISGSQ